MTFMTYRPITITALFAVACGDPTEPGGPTAGLPAQFEIVAGDAQTDTVAMELPTALRIRVRDGAGRALSGQLVNFVITQGEGTVFAPAVLTDDAGLAQNRWTLGTVAGVQTLELRAIDAAGTPVVFDTVRAMAVPGRAAQLTLSLSDTTLFLAERLAPARYVDAISDRYGNRITDRAPVVSSSWSSAGDSVYGMSEGYGWAHVHLGGARDSLALTIVRDLRTSSWTLSYRCDEGPVFMRGVENPPAGIDSLFVSGPTTSIRHRRDSTFAGAYALHFARRAIRYWGDGITDTTQVSGQLVLTSQAPGMVGTAGGLATWTGTAYAGGDLCPSEFLGTHHALVLTEQ